MGLVLDGCETNGEQNAQEYVAILACQYLPGYRSPRLEKEPSSKPLENGKALQARIQLLSINLAFTTRLTVDQVGVNAEERVYFHY